jgi:hypothetical protein
MRYLEFLRLPTEKTYFHSVNIQGRSIVVDGHVSNNTTSGRVYDEGDIRLSFTDQSRKKWLIRIDFTQVRSLIGHTPILLLAELVLSSNESTPDVGAGNYARLYRFNPDNYPNITATDSCTYRYRDASSLITWEGDAYSPVWGKELPLVDGYTDRIEMVETASYAGDGDNVFRITPDVRRSLLSGDEYYLMITPETQINGIEWTLRGIGKTLRWPYIRLYYMFPVEFFQATPAGEIDLSTMVDTSTEDHLFYLGALERGETGSPVCGFIKNFSDRTIKQLEIFDDHPEWSDPQQTTGSGTGQLDYVELATAAVSQMYEIRFTSSTDFEIRATKYRDYPTDLNPTYGGTGWTGNTSTDYVAPSGGLMIPKAAWQPGTLVNDVFTVFVKGNSTVATWPSDSGDMVQVAKDNGSNAPDAATWRPATGRRSKTRASVTVDATTKKFPLRSIEASKWIVGTEAFVSDESNIHEGDVKSAGEAEIGTDTFTGTGLDDCTISGNYNGVEWWSTLRIEIDATGTPDTFRWSKNGGSSWEATGVSCSTSATLLADGVYVTFGATTGHTLADRWDCNVNPFFVELENLTNDSTVYAAGAKIGTSSPFRNVAPAVWGKTTQAAGASQTPANRIYLEGPDPENLDPDALGFTTGQTVYIQDVTNAAGHELGTVQTVSAAGGYIDLDSNLTEDYGTDSPVMVKGSGEVKYWMRAVATLSTDEELKRTRLNVRV